MQQIFSPGPFELGTTRSGDPMITGQGILGGTTTLRQGPLGPRLDIAPGGGARTETVHPVR